jgi:hypothetical protein
MAIKLKSEPFLEKLKRESEVVPKEKFMSRRHNICNLKMKENQKCGFFWPERPKFQ